VTLFDRATCPPGPGAFAVSLRIADDCSSDVTEPAVVETSCQAIRGDRSRPPLRLPPARSAAAPIPSPFLRVNLLAQTAIHGARAETASAASSTILGSAYVGNALSGHAAQRGNPGLRSGRFKPSQIASEKIAAAAGRLCTARSFSVRLSAGLFWPGSARPALRYR